MVISSPPRNLILGHSITEEAEISLNAAEHCFLRRLSWLLRTRYGRHMPTFPRRDSARRTTRNNSPFYFTAQCASTHGVGDYSNGSRHTHRHGLSAALPVVNLPHWFLHPPCRSGGPVRRFCKTFLWAINMSLVKRNVALRQP